MEWSFYILKSLRRFVSNVSVSWHNYSGFHYSSYYWHCGICPSWTGKRSLELSAISYIDASFWETRKLCLPEGFIINDCSKKWSFDICCCTVEFVRLVFQFIWLSFSSLLSMPLLVCCAFIDCDRECLLQKRANYAMKKLACWLHHEWVMQGLYLINWAVWW